MKRLIHRIEKALIEIVQLLFFCIPALIEGLGTRFPYRKKMSGRLTVLANGPSLKNVLMKLETDACFDNTDFSVMNDFATTDAFLRIKPKYYCLADPKYVISTFNNSDVHRTFQIMNEVVSWDMILYIPSYFRKKRFLRFSRLTNSHIKIKQLCSAPYAGQSYFIHNWLYKHGLTIPRSTVAQVCIFCGINLGYEEIHLYGFDHSFINNLIVDKDNRLCWRNGHFYDSLTTEADYKPLLRNDNGQQYKIGEYLHQIGDLFQTHDFIAAYAKTVGCHLINCTRISMVDSYDRIAR